MFNNTPIEAHNSMNSRDLLYSHEYNDANKPRFTLPSRDRSCRQSDHVGFHVTLASSKTVPTRRFSPGNSILDGELYIRTYIRTNIILNSAPHRSSAMPVYRKDTLERNNRTCHFLVKHGYRSFYPLIRARTS